MNKNHFVRYGTAAEQKYMREYQHTYDGIAINGTILAHIPKAISAFMHKDVNKKFFVDPMTHSFQHELDKITNSKGEIRSSIKKLIEVYGEPIDIILTKNRPIKKTDFNSGNKSSFVENVLNFQCQHITRNIDEEYRPYIDYNQNLRREPSFLIAPYFYLKQNSLDAWLGLNIELLDIAISKKRDFKNKDVYAQMVIDKRLLIDTGKIDDLIRRYSIADGLLYWIDGLDETDANKDELKGIRNLINKYKQQNPTKLIISLYGGYFSELLLNNGLYGIVHGLEYGETRDVVPVGGGIPLSKYYLPELRKRIPAARMLSLLKFLKIDTAKKFHEEICNCKVCKQVVNSEIDDFNNFIKSKPEPITIKYKKSGMVRQIYYPERESKELCLFHYLETKNAEIKRIKKEKKEALIKELNESFKKYIKYFSEDEINYLNLWAEVVECE
jgi:hypothetical protein